MDTILSLFSELDIALAEDETVSPSQCISYLGNEIHALFQTIHLLSK